MSSIPGPEVPVWNPTFEFSGDLGHVRVLASRLTASPQFSCPQLEARKARPAVYPVRDRKAGRSEPPPFADVPVGLVRDAILEHAARSAVPTAESIEQSALRSAAPRGLAAPTAQAVQAGVMGYREIVRGLRAAGDFPQGAVLVRDLVVSEPLVGGGVVEWAAWALNWVGADGTREVHLLVWRDAGSRPRPEAVLGVIARSVAEGYRAEPLGSWSHRYEPSGVQPPAVSRVVIREVGLLDATSAVLFDDTPGQARALFDRAVPRALPLLAGAAYLPGRGCASCSIRPECQGLAQVPGVLSVAGRAAYPRSLSTSDLWSHSVCPHQVHLLSDLGLPREPSPPFEAARRGILVHSWLEAAHGRGVRCLDADLPTAAGAADAASVADPGEVGRSLGWGADEASLVAAYLQRHPDQCPLSGHPDDVVRPECSITVHDTDADVILTTRPDLVIERSEPGSAGAPDRRTFLIRETKTLTMRRLEAHDEISLIHHFPQVAAAICLLAAGVDPLSPGRVVDPSGSVVEIELLGADDASVVPFALDDPHVVLAARASLAQRVDEWVHDDTHAPRPGRQCERCPVRAWCSAMALPDPEDLDGPTVLTAGDPSDAAGLPRDILALIEADMGVGAHEEFDF